MLIEEFLFYSTPILGIVLALYLISERLFEIEKQLIKEKIKGGDKNEE